MVFLIQTLSNQVRVDFVDTELLTPDNGNCREQALTITGTMWHSGVNRICGINPGLNFPAKLKKNYVIKKKFR